MQQPTQIIVQDIRDFQPTTFSRKCHYTEIEADKTKKLREKLLKQPNVRTVELTLDEMIVAGNGAALHIAYNIHGGKKPRHNAPERGHKSLGISYSSTLGEFGVAKFFNLLWTPKLNRFKEKDVGGMVQVRSSDHLRDDSLILHRKDNDKDPFVAVVVVEPVVYLLGWCYAEEGKKSAYWGNKYNQNPAFFVPNEILRPVYELTEILRDKATDDAKHLSTAYAQIDDDKKNRAEKPVAVVSNGG